MSKYVYTIFLTIPLRIICIWPPPYEIKLTDEETFVISEFSDEFNNEEEEMIQPNPKRMKNEDKNKYFRIHQLAIRENKKEIINNKESSRNVTKIKEHNFDLEDAIPWEGGFVDKNGNYLQPENENVYYLNEMAKQLIDSKINKKREEEKEEAETENYDYKNFKAEYEAEVKKSEQQNDTLNFTDTKEDESFKESVENVINFKEPRNCSAEEMKGIGISALKCIVSDLSTSKSKNAAIQLIKRILIIGLIWFCVYAVIAIPCWCTRGWCCCCCCCKICRPRETIDEAKKFFMNNPVGVYHTKEGNKIVYQPTNYEIYAQRRLEKALFNL